MNNHLDNHPYFDGESESCLTAIANDQDTFSTLIRHSDCGSDDLKYLFANLAQIWSEASLQASSEQAIRKADVIKDKPGSRALIKPTKQPPDLFP